MMRAVSKTVAMATAVLLAAGVAGCSAQGSPSGTGAGAGGGDVTDVTEVTWWKLSDPAPAAQEAIAQVIADFEAANPDIRIIVEERSTDAHKDSLRTALGTSGAPDIFFSWAGPGLGGEFINAGASLNLEKYYDEYGWADRFSGATLDTVTQYGGYDGVPYTQRGEAIFYNKELFAQAGIATVPSTYDELVDAADKLVAAGITPIQFGGTVNWHVMRLLDALLETHCGTEGYQALVTGGASWADEACVTETYEQFALWTTDYLNPGFISINNDESSALFYSGRAAMAFEGDWFNQVVRDNGMDEANVGIFPFPTGTGRIYGFNENNYITSNSDNPDEAARFLDYLTSEEAQRTLNSAFGGQSVNTAVQSSSTSEFDQAWGPIFAGATGVYMNNDQNLSLAATTEYWRIQNLVATGELKPALAGAELQKFLDQQ
jgi:raffinose/stachyose/melibiose transport system substrate-binding protein